MTRRALVFLVLAFLPIAAHAVDLGLSMSTGKVSVFSGERFVVTINAFNHSSQEAGYTVVTLSALDAQMLTMTAPAGWTCEPGTPDTVSCSTLNFAGGAQAELRATVHVLNFSEGALGLTSAISIGGQDDPLADNSASRELDIVRPQATTALSIRATPEQNPVTPGQNAVIRVDVRNDGPDAANNVVVRAWHDDTAATMQGAGWSCVNRECTRPILSSGETAALTFSFPTSAEGFHSQRFRVGADLSFDPSGTDNFADIAISVGDAASWRRILIPLAFGETPGAFGSIWKTETTVVIDSDTPVEIEPERFCSPRPVPCQPIPLRRPFDLTLAVTQAQLPIPAQLIYVRASDESKLAFNLRVRDMTRTSETFGTEVKIVRENEWRTTPVILAPLPVDPLFRLTLRVYDADARSDARVAIRIYADDEIEPRLTLVRTLATIHAPVTTAQLPGLPGYLQLDPIAEAGNALADAERAWIRVEPLTPGLRFWAFASVTNNPTGHVTTVTPQ